MGGWEVGQKDLKSNNMLSNNPCQPMSCSQQNLAILVRTGSWSQSCRIVRHAYSDALCVHHSLPTLRTPAPAGLVVRQAGTLGRKPDVCRCRCAPALMLRLRLRLRIMWGYRDLFTSARPIAIVTLPAARAEATMSELSLQHVCNLIYAFCRFKYTTPGFLPAVVAGAGCRVRGAGGAVGALCGEGRV